MSHPPDNRAGPLAKVRHVVLDMDGTIYSGGTVFQTTLPFLQLLGELGIGHTFLTNNSSRSSHLYLAKLAQIGIQASPAELYTSTAATIEYLREQMPSVRRTPSPPGSSPPLGPSPSCFSDCANKKWAEAHFNQKRLEV